MTVFINSILSDEYLVDLSEELLDGWKDSNVTHVKRIKIRRDNAEVATKHLMLTFGCTAIPETIKTGYVKLPVRPFIPNQRRGLNVRGLVTCLRAVEGSLGVPYKNPIYGHI